MKYVSVVLSACILLLSACEKAPEKSNNEQRPVPVTNTHVKQGSLPLSISAVGHAEAPQTVEVRPQINAQIAKIHFTEGDMVKAGQVLFTLDSRSTESQLRRNQAIIEQSRAQLAEAVRNLQRTEELAQANFVSSSAVDTARAKSDSLRAQVAANQAELAANSVELSYRTITAPISGRTGAISLKQGSLAQSSAAEPLVTITQTDPIQISFMVNQRDLPAILAAQKTAVVNARLPDGSERHGKLVFLDNKVDSGTLLAKAQFDNADQQLWPGLNTTVEMQLPAQTGLIVPIQAIQTGPEQRFVYQIEADNKVAIKPITVLRSTHDSALIEGITAGTNIVLEGGQNLRPGKQVSTASRAANAASTANHAKKAKQ